MRAARAPDTAAAAAVPDDSLILQAIPDPILLVDGNGEIRFVNPAAEAFFGAGAALLCRQSLSDILPFGSPLPTLVAQVQEQGSPVSEYGVDVGPARAGAHSVNNQAAVNIQVAPVPEQPGAVVVRLELHSIASKMDRQLTHRGAARAVVGMAAVLAHEVKNPLSGIRGAAQLLEQNASPGDRELTQLICEESDRICALVDRMESFSEHRPVEREAVNIHQVLEHVRRIAGAGFASHVRFVEAYDPSLPPVYGNRDQLVQVFLNLVKNAAEAAPAQGAEVTLSTAYRHGVRLAIPGSKDRVRLALEVGVADNGPGVPEDLRPYLFDPFVTTKAGGTGLGLALVAKIIGDHGGIVEADKAERGAVFRTHLPVFSGKEAD